MKLLIVLYFSLLSGMAVALDATDVQIIEQFGIVSSKVRLHEGDWSVDASKMDRDSYEYGEEEFKDLTNWKNIKSNEWFDLNRWIKKRELKDKHPDWRTAARNFKNSEIVGRVIKCIGICRYFHDIKGIKSHFQTVIREGDEFVTELETIYSFQCMTFSLLALLLRHISQLYLPSQLVLAPDCDLSL